MKILTILLTERQTNGKIKQQSLISAFSPELKRRCVEPNNYFFKKRFFFKHNNIKNSKYILSLFFSWTLWIKFWEIKLSFLVNNSILIQFCLKRITVSPILLLQFFQKNCFSERYQSNIQLPRPLFNHYGISVTNDFSVTSLLFFFRVISSITILFLWKI